jgi:hypothetical protein
MKVALHDVLIDRDVMTKIPKQVWAWELPVLESRFPGGLARVIATNFVDRDSLPDADDEYIRMQTAYGAEQDTNQSHVSLAYDRGERGVRKLADAIEASVEGAFVEKKPKTKGKAKADTKAEVPADPLS